MAKYARLASHVFKTFINFRDWLVAQAFEIEQGRIEGPILKAGQRIIVTELKTIYNVVKKVEDLSTILNFEAGIGYSPSLKEGQTSIFTSYAPASPRVEVFEESSPGEVTLGTGEILLTQNATITLNPDSQLENRDKTSNIHVLKGGNVTLNTGNFAVTLWTGSNHETYRPNKTISLASGCSYLVVIQGDNLIELFETGRIFFNLSQDIPELPDTASEKAIPSEKAVSKGIDNLNNKMEEAIRSSSGFLVACGINPNDNGIVRIYGNTYVDPYMVANSVSGLTSPDAGNLYALTLEDNNHVNVFRSKEDVAPEYATNPNYLDSGAYGTSNVSDTISAAFPSATAGNIVSNTDTETEWIYDGISWTETNNPAGESEYIHNTNYLGRYDIVGVPTIQALAIDMVFKGAGIGGIVNNMITGTEWEKGSTGNWADTDRPIGTTDIVANPNVSGPFYWSATDEQQVTALLKSKYMNTPSTGDIVGILEGNDWVATRNEEDIVVWADMERPAASMATIDNPRYLDTEAYGTGAEAANNILALHLDAQENDVVGNTDTNTDWKFNGSVWENTAEVLGTYRRIPNPRYLGTINLENSDAASMSAVLFSLYPDAVIGNIVKNYRTNTEWKLGDNNAWYDTFLPNNTTKDYIPDPNMLGDFNYQEDWIAPADKLKNLFPLASFGNFVGNTSTGTEWEYNRLSSAWIDTDRPIGTTSTTDNPNYLGIAPYGTNPPTDKYILQRVYGSATENQFIHNISTDTYWRFTREGIWLDTQAKRLNKWLLSVQGSYSWENMGPTGITSGSLFHVISREPATDKTEVYWFSNSWNYIDFDSISSPAFTEEIPGVLVGTRAFGYIIAETDLNNNSRGKVFGLISEGDGSRALADDGTYKLITTGENLSEVVSIYLDTADGNDNNSGKEYGKPWKTLARVHVFLRSQIPTDLTYVANSGEIPRKIILNIISVNADQTLTFDSVPFMDIVGQGSDTNMCGRLFLINSSVNIKNMVVTDRIVAWKSKVHITGEIACNGIELIESSLKQQARVSFASTLDNTKPVIDIDIRSIYQHEGEIASEVTLDANTPFIRVSGTYARTSDGIFATPNSGEALTGTKMYIDEAGVILGTSLSALNTDIWYTHNIAQYNA